MKAKTHENPWKKTIKKNCEVALVWSGRYVTKVGQQQQNNNNNKAKQQDFWKSKEKQRKSMKSYWNPTDIYHTSEMEILLKSYWYLSRKWNGTQDLFIFRHKIQPDFLDQRKLGTYIRVTPNRFGISDDSSATIEVRGSIETPNFILVALKLDLNIRLWVFHHQIIYDHWKPDSGQCGSQSCTSPGCFQSHPRISSLKTHKVVHCHTWLINLEINFPKTPLPTNWKLQSKLLWESTILSNRSGFFKLLLSTKTT